MVKIAAPEVAEIGVPTVNAAKVKASILERTDRLTVANALNVIRLCCAKVNPVVPVITAGYLNLTARKPDHKVYRLRLLGLAEQINAKGVVALRNNAKMASSFRHDCTSNQSIAR
jgi:hypothetical protein